MSATSRAIFAVLILMYALFGLFDLLPNDLSASIALLIFGVALVDAVRVFGSRK